MKNKCFFCDEREATGACEISFCHDGLFFLDRKSGNVCDECFKERLKKYFKECVHLITKNGAVAKVDWDVYLDKICEMDGPAVIHPVLRALGILSLNPENNWEIVGGTGALLNPRGSGGDILYFTRKEDVVEFARLYTDKVDWLEIHQLTNCLTKEMFSKKE